MKKRVVLMVGGMGAEREVSLSTGRGFEQALKELGYPHQVLDCQADLPDRLSRIRSQVDVALLALHGKYAEDGVVQGICEYLKLPYSGSGVLASALCMDKVFSKQILLQNDIPTPQYQVVKSDQKNHFKPQLNYPLVVKPSREGSSVGVSIVNAERELRPALDLAAQYDQHILVEQYIPGMEVTVPLLDDKVLTPIEIAPKMDFYDYKNKYTEGKTDYFMPARLDEKTLQKVKDFALRSYQVCRVRCYGRVDFRVSPQGDPYVMEINTLPGCTPTSLFPKSAQHGGISFNQIVQIFVEKAALDYHGVK